ncbi:MAG: response regulator [Campylobacterales bacterium]
MQNSDNLKNKSILYVEDDSETVEVFKLILSRFIKEIHTASNGKEGLEMYKELKPDIIITDIEMPIMSGLELLNEIKKDDPNKPVVIITAFRDEAHNAKNADAVLIKPINRLELQEILGRL